MELYFWGLYHNLQTNKKRTQYLTQKYSHLYENRFRLVHNLHIYELIKLPCTSKDIFKWLNTKNIRLVN